MFWNPLPENPLPQTKKSLFLSDVKMDLNYTYIRDQTDKQQQQKTQKQSHQHSFKKAEQVELYLKRCCQACLVQSQEENLSELTWNLISIAILETGNKCVLLT